MHELWIKYLDNPEPFVGLATIVAAFLTIIAVFWSYRAVKVAQKSTEFAKESTVAARRSTEIAKEALDKTTENAQRDEFVRHFSMLLEQHNAQLEIVKSFLDGVQKQGNIYVNGGKALLDDLCKPIAHLTAFNMLRGHSQISPYMRILFHLLKYVYEDFYIKNAPIEEKKKYTSVVRSLIRNDVLFLVAINASYVIEHGTENQYGKYQKYLHEFDFFEHAIFFALSKENERSEDIVIENWLHDFEEEYCDYFLSVISTNGEIPEENKKNPFFLPAIVVSFIYKNPQQNTVIKILNALPESISWAFDAAITCYERENKNELDKATFFSKYHGAKVIDNQHGVISFVQAQRLTRDNPKTIDQDFIDTAIANCVSSGNASEKKQIFFHENRRNNNTFLYSYQLTADCKTHLGHVDLLGKAKKGFYAERLNHIQNYWKSMCNKIKEQQCDRDK